MNHELKVQQVVLSGDDYLNLHRTITALEKQNADQIKIINNLQDLHIKMRANGIGIDDSAYGAKKIVVLNQFNDEATLSIRVQSRD
ncbi:hypothetical protein Phi13:2_gp071 [Cellulophaga phage phi13:2]|uniref:Uncharacterized protein n=3 Tax=Pachyviridae TaxID=2946166 RepID=S0A2P5_9CAUD|nr:hypothetical protein Phi19:3_gp070 [Cellulophaga phage phi19:3]YP_008241106.1 hypothetical protein Phi46:3_gp063 [Cellulophaga phage phi46:3]YP_008242096.1 hypothetical protein Phi13:2_gp071 [Cellulophaga phage phi13:2]AGO47474.1 hypothetical protein Phi19:3_gp070 [Cellulophaga phage phi19:3]AGO48807.1 hypothetical protein Phi46:3_gp063 [Cellulophaga phage phi46:3]AGO49681.1 hypothetical protein Phi13:2_gp071 [Cellulophaga phage phi13:2]